jgi:predicted ArsR family transcriptional regulator
MMTNVMTKYTSRQRILDYLGKHNGASAIEICRALCVTAADVRYHLSILVSDGRVQMLGLRQEKGRGRPVKIYGPGKAAIGDNLTNLVDALFIQVLGNSAENENDLIMRALADRMIPMQAGETEVQLTRRLARTILQFNRYGYGARWEAHAAAPRIIFEHCPYAAVIAKHPELCRMDKIMLEQHLGESVEQTARLEKNDRGILFCQFVINKLNIHPDKAGKDEH